ncbi:MAG: hypothetical protein ACYCV7_02970 [Acidimicrobiales bacterium]
MSEELPAPLSGGPLSMMQLVVIAQEHPDLVAWDGTIGELVLLERVES